jgi:hypothetical protein
MYSSVTPLEELAQRSVMYWLPFGGWDNGVWADTWVILADIENEDVTAVLDLLTEADVGGYVAIPRGQKARAGGRLHLYVDTMRYHRAEDVMMVFLRGKEPRPDGARTSARRTAANVTPVPHSRAIAPMISLLALKDVMRRAIWVLIGAILIALALAGACYTGPAFYPSVHQGPRNVPAATP